ncbi:MAG: hypothetical protein K2O98_09750, partial [Lachnospiraceae bacterium]|nr:hypothetical protein [Lachnospiraceae bacterium]
MATVGGLTTSTSTSIRGYGGLASGLDRDTLIEGMTSGTTSKITQQQKKQQQLEWKQAAIQSITSKLLDFSNKYTSWSSSTNLFSSMLWGRNKITTTGTNSKFVSVSGSGASAEGVTIMGVKQLAQKAKWSTETGVSNQTLSTTKNVDITETYDIPQLPGKELEFKLGNGADAKTYTLTLKESEKLDNGTVETYDYSTPDKAMEAINKQLERVEVTGPGGTSKKLSDFVSIGKNTDGKFELTGKPGGNNFELTGGSALQYLGFGKDFTHDLSTGNVT